MLALALCCFSIFSLTPSAPSFIYTLSLHDALPISHLAAAILGSPDPDHSLSAGRARCGACRGLAGVADRKSTRLNSSHRCISYAVFCLKKKKKNEHS